MERKRWVVICEDGRVRKAALFTLHADALRFADWEHLCTKHHQIVEERSALAVFEAMAA